MKTRSLLSGLAFTTLSAQLSTVVHAQGSLTPPAGPPAPGMKTLQQLWDKMGALETQSQSQQTALSSLQSQNTALQGQISSLQTQNTALQGQLTSLQTQNTSLQTLATNLESQNTGLTNLMLSIGQGAGTLPWSISNISTGNVSSMPPVLVTDPDGIPAVCFWDNAQGLKYAAYSQNQFLNSWLATGIPTTGYPGRFSLAFNPGGERAVCYFESSSMDLKYAEHNASGWTVSTVDSTGDVGSYCNLAFNYQGQPCISYVENVSGETRIKYATFNGSTWTRSTVTADLGTPYAEHSLAFNRYGRPCISYEDQNTQGGSLRFASFTGSSWVLSTVDPYYGGGRSSLALAPDGEPAISYSQLQNSIGLLRYAKFNGSTWDTVTVENSGKPTGYETTLKFTPGGLPAIACREQQGNLLKYASSDGTKWTVKNIDSTGSRPSLAITAGGQPSIAYYFPGSSDLRYAVRTPFAAP